MIVEFKMEIDDNIIEFKSIGKLTDNVLSFKDMNNKENQIFIYLLEEEIIILQEGITSMKNTYKLNEKTKGFYTGSHNINSVTYCYTKQLNYTKNQIYIEYDFYFNENYASTNVLLIKY